MMYLRFLHYFQFLTRLRKNFVMNAVMKIHNEAASFPAKTYSKLWDKITEYFTNETFLMKTATLALMEAKSLLK